MTATAMVDLVPVTEPGIYQMSAADYFADPVPGGSLSSTGARRIIKQAGPAKYRYALDHPNETTSDVFDFGIAAHQKVLGDPDNRLVLVDADNWRTKAAQEAAEAARAEGKTPVLPKQMEVVDAMAGAIAAHPEAAELLRAASGHPEQSLFWRDGPSGVWCRSRIDWFRSPVQARRLIIVDYKTCPSADDEAFGKSAADFGYHQQDDFYRAGVRALNIDADPAFVFVAQEKSAPYLVNVIELNETAQTIGRNLNRIAINTYIECRETGVWPGYTGIRLVALPAWYERRFDEDSSVISSAAS